MRSHGAHRDSASANAPVAVCIGRLAPQKGQHTLLDAWGRVARTVPRAVLVLVGDGPDRDLVHRVVYEELVLGVVRGESRQAYREVVGRLVARGAQGVILGCTELEALIHQSDVDLPVFPCTTLHVNAALVSPYVVNVFPKVIYAR